MQRRAPSLDLRCAGSRPPAANDFSARRRGLFVTQSAVSRQVKALEADLGVAVRTPPPRDPPHRCRAGAVPRHRAGAAPAGRHDRRVARRRRPACDHGRARRASPPVAGAAADGFSRGPSEIDLRIDANNRIPRPRSRGIELAVRYCPPGSPRRRDAAVRRGLPGLRRRCSPGEPPRHRRTCATTSCCTTATTTALPSASWTMWTGR